MDKYFYNDLENNPKNLLIFQNTPLSYYSVKNRNAVERLLLISGYCNKCGING